MAPDERAPAVFLDRDGTIMRDAEYLSDPAGVEIFPGTRDALQRLKNAGYRVVIITNQSGIGRGYFTEADYRRIEQEVERQLGTGLIDATYFCGDTPGCGSTRRKPQPGMILEAKRDLQLDLARSWMIGDKADDAETGKRAGVRTILVQTGLKQHGSDHGADHLVQDLREAADVILSNGS